MTRIIDAETVCFTGRAVVDGEHMIRSKLEWLGNQIGLTPVTLKDIDHYTVLVIADVNSDSRKACKARALGCQIITPAEFVAYCRNSAARAA